MAKTLRDEDIRLNFIINGKDAKKMLNDLDSEAAKLRKELSGMKKGTDEYVQTSKRLKEVQAQQKALRNEVGITAQSISQLNREARGLRAIRQHLTPGTAEFKRVDAELQKVNARIRELNVGSKATGVSLRGMADGFNRYFGMVTAFAASALGVTLTFKKVVNEYNEFEDVLADTMKTTGLTREEVGRLNDEIKKIDTRTSQKELQNLAYVAGKLGITGREDILAFVRAADQIGVALGRDLGSVEDAVRELGKLVDIFHLEEPFGIEQALLKVGSAINELGMASTASEGYLVEFSKRTAGIAPIAGVSIQNILGLAATLDSLGQTSEVSSTAYSKLMTTMTKKTGEFARIAKMDIASFSQLIRDDANEAMIRVFEGLRGNEAGMQELVASLGEIGLEGARVTSVFGALANNTATLREQQQLANVAFEEGISLTEEANIKNNNAQALREKALKTLIETRKELGEKLAPVMTFSTNTMTYLLKATMEVINNWEKYRNILLYLVAAIAAYNFQAIRTRAILLAQNLILREGIGLQVKEAVVKQALLIKEAALTGWRVKGTIATKAATAAQRVFNVVVSQFPGFVILGAITALVKGIQYWNKNTREAIQLQQQKQDALEENERALIQANMEYQVLQRSLNDTNNLTFERVRALKEETLGVYENARAQLALAKARQMEVQQANEQTSGWYQGWAYIKAKWQTLWNDENFQNTMDNIIRERELKNGAEAAEEFSESIDALTEVINNINGELEEQNDILGLVEKANNLAGLSISELEKKASLYQRALGYAIIGSEEYNDIQKKLTETQEKLNNLQSDGNEEVKNAVDGYNALTTAISAAETQLRNYVAAGQYDKAMEVNKTKEALEAQKLVMDGIIAAGGDVNKFLDDMADSTEAELEERNQAMQQFLDNMVDKSVEAYQTTEDKIQDILDENHRKGAERLREEKEREDELLAHRRKNMEEWRNTYFSAAFSITGAIDQIFSNSRQDQLDKQLAALDAERDHRLANESLTEEQRERIQEEYRRKEAQIKRQAFIRERRAKMIMSLINTALAITEAAPSIPRMVAAGIAGAAQTAVIAAQPVPQYRRGKYLEVKGQDDGRTYRAEWIGRPKTGIYSRPSLFAEQGEELIVDAPTTRNIKANYPEILSAIHSVRVPQYAEGKNLGPTDTLNGTMLMQRLEDLERMIEANTAIMNKVYTDGLEANIYMTQFDRVKRRYDEIRSSAKAGG